MARLILDDSWLKEQQREKWRRLLQACIALTSVSFLLTIPTLWAHAVGTGTGVVVLLAYAACWVQKPTHDLLRQHRTALALFTSSLMALICSLFMSFCVFADVVSCENDNKTMSDHGNSNDASTLETFVCGHKQWFMACFLLSAVAWLMDCFFLFWLCLEVAPSDEQEDDAIAETVADEEEFVDAERQEKEWNE